MSKRARRGQGEGSIYQLDNGKWRGVLDLGWANGKRQRKYITRATRAEVSRELRQLANRAEQGRLKPGRVPTLAEWLETYLREVAAPRVRPYTLHRYTEEVELHIVPALGKVKLDKLRPEQLSAFYREKSATMAASSVRRLHAVLRRALNVAMRWNLIAVNPATLIDAPSMTYSEVQPYTLAEARKFLAAVHGGRMEARWVLAVALGLRQGETLGLMWDDIDLSAAKLRVRRTLQYRPGEGLAFSEPKTSRSRRTIRLPGSVVDALRRRRTEQDADRVAAGAGWCETGLVFTTGHGTPLSPRNDYRTFRTIIDRTPGLRTVRLHDLRHTTASLLLAEGISARVVMEILGHSQISVTLNLYSHVSPELADDAAARMEGVLWTEDDPDDDPEDDPPAGALARPRPR